ncbi:MAG: TetR/AcrR family transcriptional regulator [Rhizomicrobium sp.]
MNTATDVRRHILEVGQQLIQDKGFVAVGLSQLLAAAAVPKGSFYYYFASKEAFGEALLTFYFDGYIAEVRTILRDESLSPAARLLRYGEAWMQSQCGDEAKAKCLVVKLGAEVADLSEAMRAVLKKGTNATIAEVATCIRAGLADGSLAGIAEPEQAAVALYEYKLGVSLLAKLRRDKSAFDGYEVAIRRLLNIDLTSSPV